MQRSTVVIAIALVIFSLSAASMRAQTLAADLGKLAADNFAVLGATDVTNTGSTVLDGNLGVSPGSSITGFPSPGTVVNGTNYGNSALAISGQADATTAFGDLKGLLPVTQTLTGQDLG